jgi:endoribonuclease Dicer
MVVDDWFESDSDDDKSSRNRLMCYFQDPNDQDYPASDKNGSEQVPELIINESLNSKDSLFLPNTYQLLQCLTLKTANDDFDLERYEILGDCFLKLIVVLQIYVDFYGINEGKMASLKSMRVSNRYLYKLAVGKKLQDYIVSNTFEPKVNFIGPYMSNEKLNDLKAVKKINSLGDKSIADCVEALIGLYLISVGGDAAKGFIEWLGFSLSDNKGPVKFSAKFDRFPNPLGTSNPESPDLLAKYKTLAKLEEVLGYTFTNKAYLYQAMTHPSDTKNKHTSSFQT